MNGTSSKLKRSTRYWFPDGTLTLELDGTHFRVHSSLLCRHSILLKETIVLDHDLGSVRAVALLTPGENVDGELREDIVLVEVKESVSSRDFEALLAHLYHDTHLAESVDWEHVASLLRISGQDQLHFPGIHRLASAAYERLVPSQPLDLHELDARVLYEALELSRRFQLHSIRKRVLYWLVTTHHFDDEADRQESDDDPNPKYTNSLVSPIDRALSQQLLNSIIAHFTPIIYTPATTDSHMACTDRFADLWMPEVILPSYSEDGVYKPIESLERIKGLDWEGKGLCGACMEEKRREWTEEQERVWEKMDEWIRTYEVVGL